MMPPDSSTDKLKKALALQRLFYNMQTGSSAASTAQLTRSFGWDSADAFQQHDVQEFSRVLCDALVRSTINRAVQFAPRSYQYSLPVVSGLIVTGRENERHKSGGHDSGAVRR